MPRAVALHCLAGPRAGLRSPGYAEGVEYKGVAEGQPAGIGHDLIGVIDERISRNAPGFVPDDSLTMLTGGFGIVAIAVMNGCSSSFGH